MEDCKWVIMEYLPISTKLFLCKHTYFKNRDRLRGDNLGVINGIKHIPTNTIFKIAKTKFFMYRNNDYNYIELEVSSEKINVIIVFNNKTYYYRNQGMCLSDVRNYDTIKLLSILSR